MRAFVGVRAAQERRYRQWRGTVVPDAARARVPLIAAYRDLFSGDYLARDKQKATSQPPLNIASTRTAVEVVPLPLSVYTYIYCGTNVQRCRAWVDYERPPETFWRYRVFVSEHPVASDPVSQALAALNFSPDLVPNHTSILVALYKGTTRTKVIIVSWGRLSPGGPITPHRQTHIREETSEVFEEWLIGNGSSSWVRSDDVLREVTAARFDTADAARLSARTSVGSDPIDSCSYSGGTYGRAWVCHQNVNCFASKMWNVMSAVPYTPTFFMYGCCGKGYYVYPQNLGCAMRVDHTGGIQDKGGAPGAGLFYQTQ